MAHPIRKRREEKKLRKEAAEEIFNKSIRGKKAVIIPLPKLRSTKKSYQYFLDAMPSVTHYEDFWLRNPCEWVAKSHNEIRQQRSFLMWVFCKYKPPEFLFDLFTIKRPRQYTAPRKHYSLDLFLTWFIEIGHGASFQKIAAPIFTKKEAHLFLQQERGDSKAPLDLVLEHLIYVKCKARNLSHSISQFLSYRLQDAIIDEYIRNSGRTQRVPFYTKHFLDFLALYVKDPLLTRDLVGELLDFFNSFTYPERDGFSFKGRTLNSVVQLTNQWHLERILKADDKKITWAGLPIDNFKFTDNSHITWEIKQLTSSTSLINEGRKMHHCVGGYSNSCASGRIGIFTMSNSIDGKIATIEVNRDKRIIQIQGPCNNKVTGSERKMINRWADEKRLKFL